MDWESWQERWDRQQELYMPDREERYAAMLDVVEATTSHSRSHLESSWHLDALGAAGFTQRGLAWRGLGDALAVGVRG